MSGANADDGLYTFLVRTRPWRRIRAHAAEDWTPDRTKYEPKADKGLYCRECHRQIPWKEIDTSYERDSHSELFRIWWCPRCNNLMREDNMTDLHLAYALEGKITLDD